MPKGNPQRKAFGRSRIGRLECTRLYTERIRGGACSGSQAILLYPFRQGLPTGQQCLELVGLRCRNLRQAALNDPGIGRSEQGLNDVNASSRGIGVERELKLLQYREWIARRDRKLNLPNELLAAIKGHFKITLLAERPSRRSLR